MKKHNNTQPSNLSYYGLSLLSYLNDNHPDRVADQRFIETRSDMAAEVYSLAIRDGNTHTQAEEQATEVLYRGLHFSVFATLRSIIWDEYQDQIPEESATELALELLPQCTEMLSKHSLTDDFAETPLYDSLYSELTAMVSEHLKHSTQ